MGWIGGLYYPNGGTQELWDENVCIYTHELRMRWHGNPNNFSGYISNYFLNGQESETIHIVSDYFYCFRIGVIVAFCLILSDRMFAQTKKMDKS